MKSVPANGWGNRQALALWGIVALLIGVWGSRITRVLSFPMDHDEVWSVWQTLGTLNDTLQWTPYDWPPLYYGLVWGWTQLTGIHPFTLRLSSLLWLMIGVAGMYRLGRRLTKDSLSGGLIAGIYVCFPFTVYLSLVLRGYIVQYALVPYLLWAVSRYFEKPTVWRGVWIGVLLAILFYVHLAIVFLFGVVGLYSLIVYGRDLKVWVRRWLIPGVTAALIAMPLILNKASIAVSRTDTVGAATPLPFWESLVRFYQDYWGLFALGWLGIGLVALIRAGRMRLRFGIALTIWVIFPVIMLVLNTRFGFFSLRHLAWFGIGVALLIGVGVSGSRGRIGEWLVAGLVIITLLAPVQYTPYLLYGTPPNLTAFSWLKQQWQPGDVLIIDPNATPANPEVWTYFSRALFADQLAVVESVSASQRRVWYVSRDGQQDALTKASVEKGRRTGRFNGPWDFLFRLYEAPPDPTGVLFENGLRFHGGEWVGQPGVWTAHENQPIQLRLWWTVDRPISADYSLTVQALDSSGKLVAQSADRTGSAETPKETSRWQPGIFYSDEVILTTPPELYDSARGPTKSLQLYLTVYQWWDGVRITSPGATVDRLLPLRVLYIGAW